MKAAAKDATDKPALPRKAVAAANSFVGKHGRNTRAVVENLGQAGARVVLVGEDGMLGDVMVSDVATGEALVDAVDGLTAGEWDAETTAALKIGPAHRRRMAGPRAR
jgi:hypothetical protein